MSKPVVTRFAPSPTGFLHIGGARTALFNWLFSRHHGGQFLLRIEDTDRNRSSQEAVDAIIDGLNWLGLAWDGDIVSQVSRTERHVEVVEALLNAGHAYKCYATSEELDAMRAKAQAEGKPPRYDGRWRDRGPSDAPKDTPHVIRFRGPNDGETALNDIVQGGVTFPNKDLDDLIILRSDGTPTYNMSVVVDDHDMGITHIIRGVDHLTNAARQAQIYAAMGWDLPEMAHIPLIHGPDGAKLSKRHGALGVDAYREMGYLPLAMRNYLVRLGWSHGDQESFTDAEMRDLFSLDAIGKSAARFDFAKLENTNGQVMREADDTELTDALLDTLPFLQEPGPLGAVAPSAARPILIKAMAGLKERAKTLDALAKSTAFLFASRPLTVDEKAQKLLGDAAQPVLQALHDALSNIASWDTESLDTTVRKVAETQDLKLGKVAQPLRAALTGTTTSPGIFDVLELLGRDECLGRIKDQLPSN